MSLSDKSWYSSSQKQLSEKEIGWICPTEIINWGLETDFSDKGLKIYHEIAQALNDVIIFSEEWSEKMNLIQHVSFINYFQRPAAQGESIDPTEKDIEVSGTVISEVINCLEPEIIAVVSSKSGYYAKKIVEEKNIPYCITPHPACAWWNRRAKKYNDLRGYDLFIKFLSSYWV